MANTIAHRILVETYEAAAAASMNEDHIQRARGARIALLENRLDVNRTRLNLQVLAELVADAAEKDAGPGYRTQLEADGQWSVYEGEAMRKHGFRDEDGARAWIAATEGE